MPSNRYSKINEANIDRIEVRIRQFYNNSQELQYLFSNGGNNQTEDKLGKRELEQHSKPTGPNRHIQNTLPNYSRIHIFSQEHMEYSPG